MEKEAGQSEHREEASNDGVQAEAAGGGEAPRPESASA
jgi:hypothetical protein